MPVPSFQVWFLPLLRRVSDNKDHRFSELYDQLANDLKLSGDDRAQVLNSGKLVFENRIAWAITYLKKAGLIESTGRGLVRITPRGHEVLDSKPKELNVKFLRRYPEFQEFHRYRAEKAVEGVPLPAGTGSDTETPQDTLERVQRELRRQLTADLLDRMKAAPPAFFERLVVDLLLRMGYGGSREDAGRTIGRSGDGGLDGVISEDRLGLDVVYVQAKRWENPVGRPTVQAFAGSLEGVRARKGVLLTTSSVTADAQAYVKQIEKRIVLVDGQHLASLMIQHNVGVSVEAVYEVKKVDTDYFDEGAV